MTDWTAGYMADVDYIHDFYKELAPSQLAIGALSAGQNHGLNGENLTYCELGCGQGVTTNLLAAANPHIDFHAMDFNPSHIAGAEALAAEAGLKNVSFYEHSFQTFDDEPDLPRAFDVIVMHGIFSWVSPENRDYVVQFIAKRLKPGGLVYVSHNTLPGWSSILPLRRLLCDRAALESGNPRERINNALAFAHKLEAVQAGYFTGSRSVRKRLKQMGSMSHRYLAHEFMNEHWTPFNVEEVAAELGHAKLKYVAACHLMDHVDDICLTPEQSQVLEDERDPMRRQGLRDLILSEQFRCDIYRKGDVLHTERSAVGAWFDTRIALARPISEDPLTLMWRMGVVELEDAHIRPVLNALRDGPKTVKQLLSEGAFVVDSWGDIVRMLRILLGDGVLAPCLPEAGEAERVTQCAALNKVICKHAEDSETLRFLASPVTGSGHEVDRFEQLFLLARSEGHETPDSWAQLAWTILAPQGQRLLKEGEILEKDEDNIAELQYRAERFATQKLPVLQGLGILF
ncbi:class I SAM-dependent methyltransferase [Epibacterium ulvae]|uniref:class I SAM-dependent methyltransferase n=1 Tax=Epibacterium ulvae TaxID=1156985 RepID=UPI0024935AFB|nr:class I SAM-dependent methyltransferase [Epibacterium ulvae]